MHVWYRAASLSLNEIKVKSHLPWIYAHVRGRVKYTVVPKGDGHSAVVVRNAELLVVARKKHILG